MKRFGFIGLLKFSIAAGVMSTSASAESLNQALVSAYIHNPTLAAQRAQLRATDEEAQIARSGYRPTITATGEASISYGDTLATSLEELRSWNYLLKLEQPLFRGFRTVNSVKKADFTIRAGREDLKNVEQTTLIQAITAYVDVYRDQAILRLQSKSVAVLYKELQAAKDRFAQGDNTRTEVEQARARHARARSQLELARSSLKTSRANYERVIGHPPSGIRQPRLPSKFIPGNLDRALKIGVEENPVIQAALHREEASLFDIDIIKGELLPELNLEISYGETFYDTSLLSDKEEFKVIGRMSIPLYMGGSVSARVRQAKQINQVNSDVSVDVKIQTKQAIIAAWSGLIATKSALGANVQAVEANKIALSGVRQQQQQGQRTLLDVLNAEQELLSAQVGVIRAQRESIVAAYSLLQAIGRLTVKKLNLNVALYDPEKNYNRVKNRLFGLGFRSSSSE